MAASLVGEQQGWGTTVGFIRWTSVCTMAWLVAFMWALSGKEHWPWQKNAEYLQKAQVKVSILATCFERFLLRFGGRFYMRTEWPNTRTWCRIHLMNRILNFIGYPNECTWYGMHPVIGRLNEWLTSLKAVYERWCTESLINESHEGFPKTARVPQINIIFDQESR